MVAKKTHTYIIRVALLSCCCTGSGMCSFSLVIFWRLLHAGIWKKILRQVHRVHVQWNTVGIITLTSTTSPEKKHASVQLASSKTQTFPNSAWPSGPEKNNPRMRLCTMRLFIHQCLLIVYSASRTQKRKTVTTNKPHQQDGIEQVCIKRRLISPMASDVLPRAVNHVGNGEFGDWHRGCWLRQLRQGWADVSVFSNGKNTNYHHGALFIFGPQNNFYRVLLRTHVCDWTTQWFGLNGTMLLTFKRGSGKNPPDLCPLLPSVLFQESLRLTP